MSMLSAQIDELRNAARGQKAMGLFELAQMLNDAADTIWQLRDDLQRANAENAKLQASNEVIAEDHAALCEQNAKLRELVVDFDKCLDTALYLADSAGYLTMPDQKLFASLRSRIRELGVEV